MKRIFILVLMCAWMIGCKNKMVPIKIGVCLPLTGTFAEYGEQAKQEILSNWEMLDNEVETVNFQVERPIIADTQSDPQRAAQVMQDLIEKEHVVAILGGVSDAEFEAMTGIAEKMRVPLIRLGPMNSDETTPQVKIGVCLPLSGTFAEYGEQAKQAILAAWEEKSIGKSDIEFQVEHPIIADTQSDPQRAAQIVKDLIEKEHVVAIIGGLSDAEVEAMSTLAEENRIPLICPWTMNPRVTENRQFVFRLPYINAFQGLFTAQYVHENLQKSTAAVMVDTTQTYSTGIADAFIRYFEVMGGQVLLKALYRTGDQDFTEQLAQIAQVKPDVLYVPGLAAEVARIAVQSKEIGLDLPLIAHDAAYAQSLLDSGGQAIEGLTIITHFKIPYEENSQFWKIFGGEPGFLRTSVAALSWDAYQIIMDALEQKTDVAIASWDPSLVKSQISKNDLGVTGLIMLNQDLELSNAVGMAINISTLLSTRTGDKFDELFETVVQKVEDSYSQLLWNELQPMLLQEREKELKLEILENEIRLLFDDGLGSEIESKVYDFMTMVVDNAPSADAIGAELERRRGELDALLHDWAERKPVSEETRQGWNDIIQNVIMQVKTPNAEMQKRLDDFAEQLAHPGIEWQKSIQDVMNANQMKEVFETSLEHLFILDTGVLSVRVRDGKFVESETIGNFINYDFFPSGVARGSRSRHIQWYAPHP